MKYPKDFKVFNGKRLSSWEINRLVQETLAAARRASSNSEPLASISTGDIMIEVNEFGYVVVWQQIAEHDHWG